jgi:hypothetical protein
MLGMIENQGRGLKIYICALPSPGIPTQVDWLDRMFTQAKLSGILTG